MRSVREINDLRGKTVLLRVDFNVEKAEDALRLKKSLPTIKHLISKGAKVVLLSHRGRPSFAKATEGKPARPDRKLSLRFAIPFLKKYASPKTVFLPALDVGKISWQVRSAAPGSLFLLENLRFYPGEQTNDKVFARQLASLGNLYVNDAFAVCHHQGASVVALPQLLSSYAGLLLEEEVRELTRVMKNPRKPLVVVLAGGKADDKFAVIKNLYSKTNIFLVGGVLANTFLKARGMKINRSIVEPAILTEVKKLLKDKKIILPMDWLSDKEGKILDLGPLSAKNFSNYIKNAGTVIWNGPMGFFENPRYRAGSVAIAKAIAKSKAFSVVGGGETTQLILDLKLEKKFSFLSTGGGAMLAILAGRRLPGIEALRE